MRRIPVLVLLFSALILAPGCFADFVSGTAFADLDNDQHVNLLFGSPLPGAFWNNGTTPVPTTRNCIVGQQCQILQTITGVFNVPGGPSGSYSYDFAYLQLYFDVTTIDPVTSLNIDLTNPGMYTTGTVTGILDFFQCAPGADCPFYNDVTLNSQCYPDPFGPPTYCAPTLLAQYSLSGLAQGYTDVFNPRARVDFSFSGSSTAVPEASSLILFGTGLFGAAIMLRKRLPNHKHTNSHT